MQKESTSLSKQTDLPIDLWTTDDVEIWLHSLHLSHLVQNLCQRHGIDGLTLLMITEEELKEQTLEIHKLSDRKKLWFHICLLQNAQKDFYIRNSQLQYRHRVPGPIVSEESAKNYHYNQQRLKNNEKTQQIFKSLKGERTRTLVSFLYALIIGIWTSFIMVVVHNRVPSVEKYPPLPDLLLNNLPRISWAFAASEYLIITMGIIFLLILMFHKYWLIILRRFFALGATIFFLRSITMLVTSLSVPGSHLDCTPSKFETTRDMFFRWLEIFFFQGLSIQGVSSCGDYMFSGHTVTLTLLNHCITEYTTKTYHMFHVISWLCNIFGMFLILAAHEHYTIDVLIAFYLTSRLFLYYHSLANNGVLHSISDNRFRVWFPLFSYFEKNVQCMVPNVFRAPWPLSLIIHFEEDEGNDANNFDEMQHDKTE